MKQRLVLTGGHAATNALATIIELEKSERRKKWEIYWLGARRAFEGKKATTAAHNIFSSLGITYHPIITGRLQRKWSIHTFPSLLRVPLGFFQAFWLLLKIRPKIILSFGGFAALPVVVAGWFLTIPIIIHEQTVGAGLANKLSAFFATKICLGRIQSAKYFPTRKTVLVGNPLMPDIFRIAPKKEMGQPPTIFVTGGSAGSQIINKTMAKVLPDLLPNFKIIHQTGELDFEKFEKIKKNLPSQLKENYQIYSYVDPREFSQSYKRADLIVSRAGANTIADILASARPAVVIPLPWSHEDEQLKNAQMAAKTGLVLIIEQKNLTPEILLEKIYHLQQNWREYTTNIDRKIPKLDQKAAAKLADLVEEIIQ